jgi:hypothetical protein
MNDALAASPITRLDTDGVGWDEVADVVVDASRLVAPQSLVELLD